jgi:predicted metalloprotease with PDZ domain
MPIAAPPPTYTLTFSDTAPRRVHVDARLPLVNDTLRMSSTLVEQLPDGWATFVHELRASDGGRAVALSPLPGGRWVVRGARPAAVSLSYDVVIAHDTVHWRVSGAFAAGYALDRTVFFCGRALFVAAAGADASPSVVRVRLPNGWRIATPYRADPTRPDTYVATDLADLWANGSLVGPLSTEEVRSGALRVVFAGGPSIRAGLGVYARSLGPVVRTYAAALGGAPTGTLVVIANLSPRPRDRGGESFTRSISMLSPNAPDASTRSQWGYLLAHETFHQWNPNAFPPADQPQVEWLVEGFTDYMTRRAMRSTGLMTDDEYRRAVSASYATYAALAGHTSLRAAGADKGTNYDLLYAGGATVAAALDADLRRRTRGARGVPELLAAMAAAYRATKRPYEYDDVVRTASRVAGADLHPFFARYVSGVEVIPREALGTLR